MQQTRIPDDSPKPIDEPQFHSRVFIILSCLLTARLIYAAIVPLDLAPDEAYYWDWSRQLDYGYYSKPPMVAWLIGLSTSLGGNTPFFVRLPAVLLGTIGLGFLYLLGKRMFSPQVGFWAMCAAMLTPGNVVMSLLMTIDAPLMFCWCGTLYFFWQLLEDNKQTFKWMLLATVTCGLGFLCKQTMLGFLPLTMMYLLWQPTQRQQLKRPAVWGWAICSLLFLSPVLYWNSQNGWITLEHTQAHFQTNEASLLRHFVRSMEYSASQFGVASPITYGLFVLVGFAVLLSIHKLDKKTAFLTTFSVIPLLAVWGLSFLQRIQPNWPAPFYPAGMLLLTAWALESVNLGDWLARCRPAFKPGLLVGGLCCLMTYAMPFALPLVGLKGSACDVTARLHGWQDLGIRTAEVLQQLPDVDQQQIVAVTGRIPVSPLAFYTKGHPRVFRWNESGIVDCQHDLWNGPKSAQSDKIMVLTEANMKLPARLQSAVSNIEKRNRIRVPIGYDRHHSFDVWIVTGLSDWPNPVAEPPQIAAGKQRRTR